MKPTRPPATELDPVRELEHLRWLAEGGETDLATLREIRLGSALHAARAAGAGELAPLEAEVLSDLAVLRHQRADHEGARRLARAALALVPAHPTAAQNLAALEALPAPLAEDRSQDPLASLLNPWVRQALDLGQREAGFAAKRVVEIGGAVPEEHALATGAQSWSGCYLGAEPKRTERYEIRDADARSLPWPDACFDLAFSSCAFEHIQELPRALAEIARVLTPEGVLVTSFAPIWSCAVGHHLWGHTEDGRRVHFLDPVVPHFGHLLLDERELGWFLGHTVGAAAAERFTNMILRHPHINRVHELEYRAMFAAAGFLDGRMGEQGAWNPTHVPSPALLSELEGAHPGMGSFATPGFEGVLLRGSATEVPAARPARRGRSVFFGLRP